MEYIYTTAANGLTVRIPADWYPQWKEKQDEIRAGKSKAEAQTTERLRRPPRPPKQRRPEGRQTKKAPHLPA